MDTEECICWGHYFRMTFLGARRSAILFHIRFKSIIFVLMGDIAPARHLLAKFTPNSGQTSQSLPSILSHDSSKEIHNSIWIKYVHVEAK